MAERGDRVAARAAGMMEAIARAQGDEHHREHGR